MDEFALIRRTFAGLTKASEGVQLGIGDDAALLAVPPGESLVVTSDTLIAGRHFPLDTAAFDVGWKALAVNLSDLAAMGATPRWFTLALTLPAADADWLRGFAEGLCELADIHRVALVGGDTTRGALSLTVTAMGLVPQGAALRRDGAQVSDLVCVTGTLGDAALGLQLATAPAGRAVTSMAAGAEMLARLHRPTPRIEAGIALRGLATAAIDLSDGLAGDLGHVLAASDLGAEIDAGSLPRSPAFRALAGEDALALQLHGGDDYELCFTLPPARLVEAQARLAALSVPLTVIGHTTREPGLRLRGAGALRTIEARGYNHFERAA